MTSTLLSWYQRYHTPHGDIDEYEAFLGIPRTHEYINCA